MYQAHSLDDRKNTFCTSVKITRMSTSARLFRLPKKVAEQIG